MTCGMSLLSRRRMTRRPRLINHSPSCGKPAFTQRLAALKASERGEVTVREGHVELFHSRAVCKHARCDTLLDLHSDIPIERGKKTKAVLLSASAQDDLIEF